jgi:hypothetical protein
MPDTLFEIVLLTFAVDAAHPTNTPSCSIWSEYNSYPLGLFFHFDLAMLQTYDIHRLVVLLVLVLVLVLVS